MARNTDLATTNRAALDTLKSSLANSSLSSLVQATAAAGRRSLLLVDCSSSMRQPLAKGGTRISELRNVVEDLRTTHPVPVAAFSGDGVRLVDGIPNPTGGTPMSDAIEFGTTNRATHLVVVTDGVPNSESAAFEAAREFGGRIDVYYIGNGGDEGARFCQRLAKMTGGTCGVTDLGDVKALSAGIKGLLGTGGAL